MKATELIESMPTIGWLCGEVWHDFVKLSDVEPIIERLCGEIKTLKKANEWIKVEDGLPESYVKVLVKCRTGNVTISSRYQFGYNDYWKGSGTFTASITHWKPINN